MSDSELREQLDEKHERNREQRLEAVKHWAQYIKENPPEDWGSQQNRLIDSQLQSARASDLDVDHYRRIRKRTR